MDKLFAVLSALALSFPAMTLAQDNAPTTPEPSAAPQIRYVGLETDLGVIVVAIEIERAPITAANFLRYVDEKRFDGIVFYRSMKLDWEPQPNGLIQAGTQFDPKRTLPPIAHEPTSTTGVLHGRGAISMARWAPGSATGDFSILLQAMPGMDADPTSGDPELVAGYAAFGHVVAGMDVVEAIQAAPADPDKGEGWMKGQMLARPVKIIRARRVAPVSTADPAAPG